MSAGSTCTGSWKFCKEAKGKACKNIVTYQACGALAVSGTGDAGWAKVPPRKLPKRASHSRLPARSLQDRRIRLQLEFKASIGNSRGRAGWWTLFWMAHRRKGLVAPAIEARSGDHALISVKRPGPDVAQIPNATVEMEWGECAARVADFFCNGNLRCEATEILSFC
jgi:hypothetical protein